MMKRILLLVCLSMLFCAGCKKDDAGISSDPADLIGKWKEVKLFESWKENGRWHTEIDWEDSAEEADIYYWIFNEDGTFEQGKESKSSGKVVEDKRRGTWSYSDKKIMFHSSDWDEFSLEVLKLTSSELIVRDHFDNDEYDDLVLKRMK